MLNIQVISIGNTVHLDDEINIYIYIYKLLGTNKYENLFILRLFTSNFNYL